MIPFNRLQTSTYGTCHKFGTFTNKQLVEIKNMNEIHNLSLYNTFELKDCTMYKQQGEVTSDLTSGRREIALFTDCRKCEKALRA